MSAPFLRFYLNDETEFTRYVKRGSVSINKATGGRTSAGFTVIPKPDGNLVDDIGAIDEWTDTYTLLEDGELLFYTTYYVAGLPTVTIDGVPAVVCALADTGSTPGWQFYYLPYGPGISFNQALTPLVAGVTLEFTYPVGVPTFGGGISASPAFGPASEVTITYAPTGAVLFGGLVDTTEATLWTGTSGYFENLVRCIGYSAVMDRRVVGAVYPEADFGTVESVMQELVDTYLDGTGISYDGHAVTPNAVGTQIFNWEKVGDAARKLTEAAGCDFYVDDTKVLKLVSASGGTGAAPFAIEQNDGNWRSLTRIDGPGARFWNRAIVRSSRSVTPVRTSATTTAGAATVYPTSIPRAVESPEFIEVVMNGNGIGPGDWSVDRDSVTLDTAPANGLPLELTAATDIDAVAIAEDAASIAAVGLWEHVREVKDIPDGETADSTAAAVLAEGLNVSADALITTHRVGLDPGQSITIDANGVDMDGIIQQVDLSDSEQGKPLWTVRVSGRPKRKLTGADFYNRLIDKASKAIDRTTTEIRFKLAESIAGFTNPGVTAAALEDGAVAISMKKGPVRRVGMYFKEGAGCKIDVLQNGVSIFQGGGITWSGAGPVFTSLLGGNPLVLDIGDVLTLAVVDEDATARDGYLSIEQMA